MKRLMSRLRVRFSDPGIPGSSTTKTFGLGSHADKHMMVYTCTTCSLGSHDILPAAPRSWYHPLHF